MHNFAIIIIVLQINEKERRRGGIWQINCSDKSNLARPLATQRTFGIWVQNCNRHW